MPQTPGDEKKEPSLELPTLKLPGLGRRRRRAPEQASEQAPEQASEQASESGPEAPPTMAAEPPPPSSAPVAAPPRRQARVRKAPRSMSLPALPGPAAAALTGLGVGLAGGAATYGALAACEVVRGVSTCGGAPGFFILVAIVVLMVLLGGALLKAFGVRDSTSTSFLGVGLVAVVVMLTLLDAIMSPWMFVVIPTLSALAYLLAHWVTTRFDDEATGRRDWT